MATATTIPDRIWEMPCVHTAVGTYRFPRDESSSFVIVKMCQRPLDPTTVDIYFRAGLEGVWVLDIEDCGYKDADGDWYQLKPDVSDIANSGTLVSANAGGTAVTYTYTAKAGRPNLFHLVWDASDYADFLEDEEVEILFVLAAYATHSYYTHEAISPVGDNGQGAQTSITKPASALTEKLYTNTFDKGFTEPLYTYTSNANGLQFVFTLASEGLCDCYTVCGTETIHGLCPGGNTYTLDIPSSSVPSSDPFRQTVSFQDSLGNTTEVIARALDTVTPPAPTVTIVGGTQMTLDINYTHGIFDLSEDAAWYRIERYMVNDSNRTLVSDWTDVTGTDQDADTTNLIAGLTYGYRVRFKTTNGSLSAWSAWATETYTS